MQAAAASGGWQLPQIRVMVNSMRLKQAMGLPSIDSAADARAHASACAERYAAWRPAAASCTSTEFGLGEEAIEAAVAALVAAYGFERDMCDIVKVGTCLLANLRALTGFHQLLRISCAKLCLVAALHTGGGLQAVALLESALDDRPSSPALRLALCALASLLGMADLALEQADALQLRQVQFDSMAHHLLPIMASHGRDRRTSTLFRQVRCARLKRAVGVP